MAATLLQSSSIERKFDDEWSKAKPTVVNLLNRNKVTQREWQDLFMTVHNIYSWVDSGVNQLRNSLHQEIQFYIFKANMRIGHHRDEHGKLVSYAEEWHVFFQQTVGCLPLPFKIVDEDREAIPLWPYSVRETMLKFWNDQIFNDIRNLLLSAVEKLIKEERNGNGDKNSSKLIIAVRDSFVYVFDFLGPSTKLILYREEYEKAYIENTVSYYQARTGDYMREHGVISYMQYADGKLQDEKQRANLYLYSEADSHTKLMDSCVKVLVTEFEEEILNECSELIKNNDIEKLKMLYRLVKRTPAGIDTIISCIHEHICTEGINDMKNHAEVITTDAEKYVRQLLTMFDRFTTLVSEGFYDDARLLTARDKAFREVVNDTSIFRLELAQTKRGRNISVESKCPELLANYCDLLLRKTSLSRKLTSEEIDEALDEVLLVLKYVNNKDVFMRFYKTHLSRRLILDTTADSDKEEIMIARLRENGMPADHINKLSRMIQDIELNKDLNSNFKKTLIEANNTKTPADLINLKVLNAGAWGRGGAEKVRVTLPRELEDYIPEVESFYKNQHNGRRLTWMHHWSTGTMTFGTGNGGRFDLDVTTFQMTVLCSWNDRAKEKISLEGIRLCTELPDTELCRTLMSLVSYPKMKSQILQTDAPVPLNPREFNDSTLFWVNHDFHLIKNGKPQHRGRLNLVGRLQLMMEPSTSKEHEDIVALREFRVQEAIVKIMKMRKTMTSGQLQTEIVELLKPMFLPHRRMVKEQIDYLIENKFIERKQGDINTFVYVA